MQAETQSVELDLMHVLSQEPIDPLLASISLLTMVQNKDEAVTIQLIDRKSDVVTVCKKLFAYEMYEVDKHVISALSLLMRCSREYLRYLSSPEEFDLAHKFVDLLVRYDDHKLKLEVLKLLGVMADPMEVKQKLVESSVGLWDVLRGFLVDDTAHVEIQTGTLKLLSNLCRNDACVCCILSDSSGEIRSKLKTWCFSSDNTDLQSSSCSLLANLAYRVSGAKWLLFCDSMFDDLIDLLDIDGLKTSVWGLFANAAHTPENRDLIFHSDKLNLIPRCLDELDSVVDSSDFVKERVVRLLWGLSAEREITASIVSEGWVLIPRLLTLASESGGKALRFWVCRLLVQLAAHGNACHAVMLLQHNAHVVALRLIEGADFDTSRKTKENKWDGYSFYCLSFIMHLANFDEIVPVLKACEMKPVDTMLAILNKCQENNGVDDLMALFTLAFLIGRDEILTHALTLKNIISSRPDVIKKMVSVLAATLSGSHGKNWRLGDFSLQLIIHACMAMSVTDEYKEELAKTELIGLMITVIKKFLDGDKPIKAPDDSIAVVGGGGSDVVSASLAVATLLHLSFLYKDNAVLQDKMMPPELHLFELLSDLERSGKLAASDDSKNISFLLSRLRPLTPNSLRSNSLESDLSGRESTISKRTHVMLSYSWKCKQDLVIKLENQLKQMGYDIWRDQSGSSLLGRMDGSMFECMSKALELSSLVIIFVSKFYKESPNCRSEGEYAATLRNRKKCELLFVMMDENYTTVSQPDCCDGWLGLIIGSQFWQQLYSESDIENVIADLSLRIPSSAIINSDCNVLTPVPMTRRFSSFNGETTFGSPSVAGRSRVSDSPPSKNSPTPTTDSRKSVLQYPVASDFSMLGSSADNINNRTRIATALDKGPDQDRWNNAFTILCTKECVIHPDEMGRLLCILGVNIVSDLAALETNDLLLISNYLKPGPRNRFLSHVFPPI